MKRDLLTPKERMKRFSQGLAIDHIPIVPDMGVTMSDKINKTTYEYYTDPKVIRDTEVFLFKELRHDNVCVSTTLRGMAEAMGSKIEYPEDNISLLKEPVVKSVEDIDKLEIINPKKDGKLNILLEALQMIEEEIGDEADIGASMTGPFSVCASVLGTENLLRWMVRKKDELHRLMSIIVRCNEEYIKALGAIGFSTGFCDPVSSTSLIKKSQFDEFSRPYLKMNFEHVQKYCKSKPTIHICGKSRELWEDVVEAGCGNFSIDNCESLEEAKKVMGPKVCITGNVPPVEVMYMGSEKDIERAVKKCIREAHDSENGYILCTGCQIPKGSKLENIKTFMEFGRKYGSYPIKEEELID